MGQGFRPAAELLLGVHYGERLRKTFEIGAPFKPEHARQKARGGAEALAHKAG